MPMRIIIIAAFIASGCGSKTHAAPDAAVDAYYSKCGHPGDLGNELGIGKFCTSFSDCSTTQAAPLCSVIGDATTHFCTKTCSSTGPTDQCGTVTTCECNGGNQCGCTPNACLGP